MNDEKPPNTQIAGNETRKPYVTPKLIVHGTVKELTQTASGALTDTLNLGSH